MPSLHAVPSTFGGLLHMPVVALHVPALWHWSLALHWVLRLGSGAQTLFWQVSPHVHGLPSAHTVPL
jgi:hypothetical protein